MVEGVGNSEGDDIEVLAAYRPILHDPSNTSLTRDTQRQSSFRVLSFESPHVEA